MAGCQENALGVEWTVGQIEKGRVKAARDERVTYAEAEKIVSEDRGTGAVFVQEDQTTDECVGKSYPAR